MRNGSIEGSLLVHPVVNPKEANKTNQNLKVLSNGAGGGWRVVSIDPF